MPRWFFPVLGGKASPCCRPAVPLPVVPSVATHLTFLPAQLGRSSRLSIRDLVVGISNPRIWLSAFSLFSHSDARSAFFGCGRQAAYQRLLLSRSFSGAFRLPTAIHVRRFRHIRLVQCSTVAYIASSLRLLLRNPSKPFAQPSVAHQFASSLSGRDRKSVV